jgi:FkbM family methyltransferase
MRSTGTSQQTVEMLLTLKLRLLRFLQDHRRNPLARRVGSLARTIHRGYEHPGYDFARNGEAGVLETLRGDHLNVVLDVGANHGDWTAQLLRFHSHAQVHLFEIAPPAYDQLSRNFATKPNVTLYPFGLGSHAGRIPFHYYPGQDMLSSAALHVHPGPEQTLSGELRRGDVWARATGIEKIDYLKVDVEGMELDVIRSFGEVIERNAIRFIQFEHHGGRSMLYDFYEMLGASRYKIGKIYSRYVDFRDHGLEMEDGIGPNYLAVLSNEVAAVRRLHVGW